MKKLYLPVILLTGFRCSFFGVLLISLFVLVNGSYLYAQDTLIADSGNFVPYLDKILIKANISSQTDQYKLKEKGGLGLRLRANSEYKVFLSLDYEFIGFSYGFSPGIFSGNKDNYFKGKSSFTDYRFLVFLGRWLQQIEYNRIKGYYAENTGDFIPGWRRGTDPFIQFSNLKNVEWSMSTAYVFNRNFSFKNIVYQTEWQKRSAGSFVPTLFYDYTRSSFDMGGIRSVQKDFNIRLGLGYYYTFIIAKRFFLSPNLIPSIGIRLSDNESAEAGIISRERKNYFTRFIDGGLKAGFNANRFVAGAGLNFNFDWYNEGSTSVVAHDKIFGILYFGYRFNAPEILNNTYQKLNKLLGL